MRRIETGDAPEEGVFITSRDRQIRVTGVGEMSVPPDRFSLTIRISTKKDNAQDAKNSVTRRLDYVKQTLTHHNVQVSVFKTEQKFMLSTLSHSRKTAVSAFSPVSSFPTRARACVRACVRVCLGVGEGHLPGN